MTNLLLSIPLPTTVGGWLAVCVPCILALIVSGILLRADNKAEHKSDRTGAAK